jgi:hypothetical protein
MYNLVRRSDIWSALVFLLSRIVLDDREELVFTRFVQSVIPLRHLNARL